MPFSEAQQFFINLLRSQISMRVANAAGSSYQLMSRLGDTELWEDLRLGINMFNTYPPSTTFYAFKDIYVASQQEQAAGGDPAAPESESPLSIFLTSIMMCSMFFTMLRLQIFEAGKHFRYNDNGVSIERVKQADYGNIVAGSILQYITTVLPVQRKAIAFNSIGIKGQFSGLISFPRSLTRGLRGTRLGFN
jgi:hypothetical protein